MFMSEKAGGCETAGTPYCVFRKFFRIQTLPFLFHAETAALSPVGTTLNK